MSMSVAAATVAGAGAADHERISILKILTGAIVGLRVPIT